MKIPKQARCVFRGVIFDVYQWKHRLYDGSTVTFERLKRPDTVQVIATSGKKIFISDEKQPDRPRFFSLFGGRIEVGETPLEAAKREFFEESGMESPDWEFVKYYEPVVKIDWKIHLFIARHCEQKSRQQLEAGERIRVRAVSFQQFFNIVFSSKFRGVEFSYDMLKMRTLQRREFEAFRRHLFDGTVAEYRFLYNVQNKRGG